MLRRRLRSLLWRIPVEEEVREELALHVELRTRDLVANGMDPVAARAEAERRLGDPRHIEATLQRLGAERNRTWARQEWLAELVHDVRFALRQARLQPGFTLATVLTLGIGLGATTAIFSVVHAVVLAPFPFAQPERVLFVTTTWKEGFSNTSAGNFDYLRQRVTTLDPIAASAFTNFNLTGGDQPERISALRTTWTFFPVFGIPPALGRTFGADEDQPGREKVVVLSHGLWQRRFGGDPGIVGRQLRLNNEPWEVIGVMPASFDVVADGAEVIVPIAFTPERLAMYDEHYLDLSGRMAEGISLPLVNRGAGADHQWSAAGPRQVQRRSRCAGRALRRTGGWRLPAAARGADGCGAAGADHRLRERREPAAGAPGGTLPRARDSRRDRRRPRAHRPAGAGGKPGAGAAGRCRRPARRGVGRADAGRRRTGQRASPRRMPRSTAR